MKNKRQIFLLSLAILTIGLFVYFLLRNNNETNYSHDTYQYSTIQVNELSFDITKIAPENIDLLAFYYNDKNNQKFSTISNLKSQKERLIFATNGGIFSKTYEPLGLYIENGITISKLNTNTGEGNFYLQPNGVFLTRGNEASIIETKEYQNESAITNAIQSGPLLVIDDKINSSFDENSQNKYIRSGVGTDRQGNVIFAISNQVVSFYEFASLFKDELECNNALYLDGAISEMYIPEYKENTKGKFGVIIGIEDK